MGREAVGGWMVAEGRANIKCGAVVCQPAGQDAVSVTRGNVCAASGVGCTILCAACKPRSTLLTGNISLGRPMIQNFRNDFSTYSSSMVQHNTTRENLIGQRFDEMYWNLTWSVMMPSGISRQFINFFPTFSLNRSHRSTFLDRLEHTWLNFFMSSNGTLIQWCENWLFI